MCTGCHRIKWNYHWHNGFENKYNKSVYALKRNNEMKDIQKQNCSNGLVYIVAPICRFVGQCARVARRQSRDLRACAGRFVDRRGRAIVANDLRGLSPWHVLCENIVWYKLRCVWWSVNKVDKVHLNIVFNLSIIVGYNTKQSLTVRSLRCVQVYSEACHMWSASRFSVWTNPLLALHGGPAKTCRNASATTSYISRWYADVRFL